MDRRAFIASGIAVAAIGTLGVKAQLAQADLPALLAQLTQFQGKTLTTQGVWSVSEVFQHCTLSIIGSMQGYPEAKSAVFQATVGQAAFQVFKAAGAMRHHLSEHIPGLSTLDKTLSNDEALAGLIAALSQFSQYQGPLAPHFAYGQLSHADYALAHQLHIRNHLQEFQLSV